MPGSGAPSAERSDSWGAEQAVVAVAGTGLEVAASETNFYGGAPGQPELRHFNDEVVAKIEVQGEGRWILMGRVLISNIDGDPQWMGGKLVHQANVKIDEARVYAGGTVCLYVQAWLEPRGNEIITLEANTYNGVAAGASLIAFKVDTIEVQ